MKNLSADFRIGIDVMTTETTCLSSIWQTDEKIEEFYEIHGRKEDYKELKPGKVAYYDGCVEIDLEEIRPMIAMPFHPSNTYTIEIHGRKEDYKELKPGKVAYYDGCVEIDLEEIRPMIAMPFHPSNTYTIDELKANLKDILADVEKKAQVSLDGKIPFTLQDKVVDGKLYVDQGIIAGCAGGGFENILADVEKKAQVSLDGKIPFTLQDKVVDGKLYVDQGIIAGCAGGGFENICAAADILKGSSIGADAFTLSVYPASTPIYMELAKNGVLADLLATGAVVKTAFCGPCFGAGDTPANNAFSIRHTTRNFPKAKNGVLADLLATGAVVKTAFCGPCFGAGDTPANNAFSIRHTTRNFPNREGSKIQNGQISSVALMDARSIAATAANKGFLTSAEEYTGDYTNQKYFFDKTIYDNRVFDSKGVADPSVEIQFGPNIKDWPKMAALADNLVLKVVSEIHDPVTTTDELIPSGETSSYRSNPLGLAEFTLSRKDPAYVGRAKEIQKAQQAIQDGKCPVEAVPELKAVLDVIHKDSKEWCSCRPSCDRRSCKNSVLWSVLRSRRYTGK